MVYQLGANWLGDDRYSFLVWAPFREKVALRLLAPREETIVLDPAAGGYFQAVVADLDSEPRYFFVLDDELTRPDPASHYQPEGVHEASQAVNHRSFQWHDEGWRTPPLNDYLTYELHIGTFTAAGTFEAAIARLPYLRDELGVTAIEIMPVAQFPGGRNWGYDGVHPFAVQNTYGGPNGLKALVDACHQAGLAVILDVVYNHLGPEGNYLSDFGPYFTSKYHTPWGMAVNFDGARSDEVRRFFIENALHWIDHYHIDALRLDAVHGIFDFSAKHILQELKEEVSARASQQAYLIAESDLNDVRLINPEEKGGYGLAAQWLDDYHHTLHTILTGEDKGYYADFGSVEQLATSLREGYVYSGQYSRFRKRRFGNSARHRPASQFIVFSQNHDQVGNRMTGDRLAQNLPLAKLKVAAALVLLSPYLPLLFMGEEYGETAPFQYFISHQDAHLVEAVRSGRKAEFASFAWEGEVPDPQAESTFQRSKVDLEQRRSGWHRQLFDFYRHLIHLRKTHPVLRTPDRSGLEIAADPHRQTLTMLRNQWGRQLFYAVNFDAASQQETVGLPGKWRLLVDSQKEKPPASDTVHTLGEKLTLAAHSFLLYEMER